MKTKIIVLIFCLLCSLTLQAQNCQMSYEQRNAVELAKQSIAKIEKIAKAGEKAKTTDLIELVENCSSALGMVNNCPDIYYFYEKLIKTYRSLTIARDLNELYYYSQSIKYCENYIIVTNNESTKEAYHNVLNDLKEDNKNARERIIKSKKIKEDSDASHYAYQQNTIEGYRLYLLLFPQGYSSDDIQNKLNKLIEIDRCAKDNRVFAIAQKDNTLGAYKRYLELYPDGCNSKEAKQKIEELAFNEAVRQNTIEAYEGIVKTYPNSQYVEEAKTRKCLIKANSYWEQIKNSTSESDFQYYINTFSCIKNRKEADNKIENIRYYNELERGKQYSLSKDFKQAKISYEKAQNIKNTQEVRDSIHFSQIELDYDTIRREWNNKMYDILKYEKFLSDYENNKYSEEVKKMLCERYLEDGIGKFKLKRKNETAMTRDTAKNYFNKVLSLNCEQANTAKKYLAKITRKENRINWNTNYYDRNCYSAVFETNNLSGYSNDYLLGISIFRLQNQGVGWYVSYRASNNFYLQKKELNNYPAYEYNLNEAGNKTMSSLAVSFGFTKKIYRPIFCYFGVGAGMNTLTQKYSVTNLTEQSLTKINGIDKTNRSLFVSPELGLMVDLWGLTFMAGIKYPISINKTAGYQYKSLIYQVGVGFGITDIKSNRILYKKFQQELKDDYEKLDHKPCDLETYQNRRSGKFETYKTENKNRNRFTNNRFSKRGMDVFGSVGMDFGYPYQNLSFSKDEMIYNKSYTLMIAFLQTPTNKRNKSESNNNWGGYFSLTANPYLFTRKQGREITDKNLTQKTAKAVIQGGPTVKIAYPVWLYFGAGVQYTKVFEELGSNGWVSSKEAAKWAISPQLGVMFNLWGFFISVGINHPIYFEHNANNNGFNPRLSITIGGGGRSDL